MTEYILEKTVLDSKYDSSEFVHAYQDNYLSVLIQKHNNELNILQHAFPDNQNFFLHITHASNNTK